MLQRDGPDLLGATSLDGVVPAVEGCDCDLHWRATAASAINSNDVAQDRFSRRSKLRLDENGQDLSI
jgi:hypothetical protein